METKKNNTKGFSSIISSITNQRPIDINKIHEEELDQDTIEEKSSNEFSSVVKQKGKRTPKDKSLSFLTEIIDDNKVIVNKGQIHVCADTVNKIKTVASISGIPMIKITDAILSHFLAENKDNIKKMINRQI